MFVSALFIKKYEKVTLLILFLVFVSSAALALYHFAIEQGFLSESLACTAGNFAETLSKEQILEQLKLNGISCKNVSFRIFGFSLAAINTIFSIGLSVIFIKLFTNYGKN